MKNWMIVLSALMATQSALAADTCVLSTWTPIGPRLHCNGIAVEAGLSNDGTSVENNAADASKVLSSKLSEGYEIQDIMSQESHPSYLLAKGGPATTNPVDACILSTWTENGPRLYCNGILMNAGLSDDGTSVENNAADASKALTFLGTKYRIRSIMNRDNHPTYLLLRK